ncbi:MAG: hypothetical protein R3C18_15795 [Planctomycetaceae bacterium]
MCRSEFHRLAGQQQVLAVNLLKARLRVEKFGRHLTASMIARVMIWISLMRSAACARLQLPVGEETVRSAFHAAMPTIEDALKLIQDSIPPLLLKHLQKRKRGSCIAIDLHHQPYYGKLVEGVHKAKSQQGTKRFWSIATAAIVTRGERFTLAVAPVYSNKMVDVLQVLWSHLRKLNIKAGCLLLDRGFYGGPVIRWLQERELRFEMPLIRRGSASKGTGMAPFFRRGQSGFRTYSWQERNHGPHITIRVAIVPNPQDRRRPYAFAVHGKFASIQQCAKWYKRRFSIESSYREAKQIRGWTTSHNGKWRRLLQVLSFMPAICGCGSAG